MTDTQNSGTVFSGSREMKAVFTCTGCQNKTEVASKVITGISCGKCGCDEHTVDLSKSEGAKS